MRALKLPQITAWHPYVVFDKEFSASECDAIIHLAKFMPPAPAMIGGSDTPKNDPTIRSSELHWIHPDKQSEWIFQRLENTSVKVRASWYPFSLTTFNDAIQITHYSASEGGHYDWHQDFGPLEMSTRKLSFVTLLNDPSEFKGGELELMGIVGADKKVSELSRGSVIAFPSWEFHRVLKITEGQRWSLVSWIHGPPFS